MPSARRPKRNRMLPPPIKLAAVAALSAATLGAATLPQPALAGTVEITSCGDVSASGVDNAWQYRSDDTVGYEHAPKLCPPDGSNFGGVAAWTKLNSGVAPAAPKGAQLRFTAPAGTTVSRVQIKRDLGLRDDGYYVFGRTDSAQLPAETCTIPVAQFTCDVGGVATPAADFQGLNAGWVAWGFECGANSYVTCGTGSTLHQAWAVIYASTVTLTDNQAPPTPTLSGALTTPGWKAGTVAATATASDNLGIEKIRWYVDATLLAGSETTRTCDFTTPVPCSNLVATATSLDTTTLSDGTRSVQLAVVDPAGNETKSSAFTVDVDNTPPAAPTGLTVTGGGSSPSFGMSWTNPANPTGAPLASASWEACRQGGGGCVTGTGTLSGATGWAAGTLPASGTYDVEVWLTDAAGNASQTNSAIGTVAYGAPIPPASGGGGGAGGGGGSAWPTVLRPIGPTTPRTPIEPTPPPDPTPPETPRAPQSPSVPPRTASHLEVSTATFSRKTRTLTVRGVIDRRATGTVTVTITDEPRAGRKPRRKTVSVRIVRGRFSGRIVVPSSWSSAKRATVQVRYAGSAVVRPATATARVRRRTA